MALNKNVQKDWTGMQQSGASTMECDFLTGLTMAAADRILSAVEVNATILEVTTGHATNAIVIPTALAIPGKLFIVANADGVNAALIKVAGGTAVTVALSKTATVRVNSTGTQVLRVTGDI